MAFGKIFDLLDNLFLCHLVVEVSNLLEKYPISSGFVILYRLGLIINLGSTRIGYHTFYFLSYTKHQITRQTSKLSQCVLAIEAWSTPMTKERS